MDRYCTQWAIDNCGPMREHQKYRTNIRDSDCGLWAAVVYPSANWHRCQTLMKWSLMFFICDDYHDICVDGSGHPFKVNHFWHQMNEALDTLLPITGGDQYYTRVEWPDYVKGAQQVMRDLYFDFSDQQIRRSVDSIKGYVAGNIGECQWSEGSIEWTDYMNARLGSVGGHMALQLIEYANDIELTDEEWQHPWIQTLNRLVGEEMTLINDYYTFRKEVMENGGNFYQMRHPFALLVTGDSGHTLQSAVNKVREMIVEKDTEIVDTLRAIDACVELRTANIGQYLRGVNEFLGGYWLHAVTARRYHGLDYLDVIPLEGQFVFDKNRTIIKPSNVRQDNFKWLKNVPGNVQPK
ncbi:unnamed protein product [Medioppia subpectinata]|uniref:Terpene synthase n=1 Tax=Medioppia subpectinata TaxID=1979941 RepID=A0A7R9Q1I9_9ACAR|nr:unnamed protein product [Medioppia subpectinata]CAG2108354.1 unnamed protein product [Medioppia subpectinata]